MKTYLWLITSLAAIPLVQPASANTVSTCTTPAAAISCTGTLDTPEDVFLETFTLAGNNTITVQTYGFGGGTNAGGAAIPAGGFDSLVALFSGPANNATILLDSSTNPIASGDTLGQFTPGCPPAGTVTVGSVPGNCGDNQLVVNLGPGTYTLLLSDTNFVPLSVNPGILTPFDLTDTTSNNYGSSTSNGAYSDLSGGVFQTCASSIDCNIDTGNFAVDIVGSTVNGGPPPMPAVPEPSTVGILAFALAALMGGRTWALQLRRSGR
jgi:hypothetical protein